MINISNGVGVVTILMPFVNGVGYLREAIASVVAQTSDSWRLIVWDNHRQTEMEDELDLLFSEFSDSRISRFRQIAPLEMAQNWNGALALADSEFAMLLHSDDTLEPSFVESMLAIGQFHTEASAFFCGTHIIGPNGAPFFSVPDLMKRVLMPSRATWFTLKGHSGIASLIRGNFICAPTLMYRIADTRDRKFEERWKFLLDLAFTVDMLFDGKVIVGYPHKKLYNYRRHTSNATVHYAQSMLRFEEEVQFYNEVASLSQERLWFKAASVAKSKSIVKLNLLFCAAIDALHGQWANARRSVMFYLFQTH